MRSELGSASLMLSDVRGAYSVRGSSRRSFKLSYCFLIKHIRFDACSFANMDASRRLEILTSRSLPLCFHSVALSKFFWRSSRSFSNLFTVSKVASCSFRDLFSRSFRVSLSSEMTFRLAWSRLTRRMSLSILVSISSKAFSASLARSPDKPTSTAFTLAASSAFHTSFSTAASSPLRCNRSLSPSPPTAERAPAASFSTTASSLVACVASSSAEPISARSSSIALSARSALSRRAPSRSTAIVSVGLVTVAQYVTLEDLNHVAALPNLSTTMAGVLLIRNSLSLQLLTSIPVAALI
mmetsp:Transcript_63219/g.186869  ORF Transcript_63219/g.186869 Transcript_63219/m.186869 type:complete len:297 (-) Transcript_63219:2377-3267(-)